MPRCKNSECRKDYSLFLEFVGNSYTNSEKTIRRILCQECIETIVRWRYSKPPSPTNQQSIGITISVVIATGLISVLMIQKAVTKMITNSAHVEINTSMDYRGQNITRKSLTTLGMMAVDFYCLTELILHEFNQLAPTDLIMEILPPLTFAPFFTIAVYLATFRITGFHIISFLFKNSHYPFEKIIVSFRIRIITPSFSFSGCASDFSENIFYQFFKQIFIFRICQGPSIISIHET